MTCLAASQKFSLDHLVSPEQVHFKFCGWAALIAPVLVVGKAQGLTPGRCLTRVTRDNLGAGVLFYTSRATFYGASPDRFGVIGLPENSDIFYILKELSP